ncbi:uncharacterized protein LOC106168874 [Lingula anatina]|uniref:Uncharacterized protein LOC106168874 n=1 Tax=Lingula anatina TaxID=7574 RepID=A0A1S3IZA9_LINAN|nr:uncharacterized protein LOC106168874 [Lingula anatina]|eukprot:XP_013403537.1 uncharacterized protein LOC106168874 [Lingula anatina]
MVPTPIEQIVGLQNISTDVQHSTSTCHDPLKAPHAFQQLTDTGTILSGNNAVLSEQKGFRNEQQQQRQQQQDSQLTQSIPISLLPRRTSTKDLGNIAASSPMHLALPTLSFEPSMAATTTSATRDLHLTSHSLRLQLLHQRYKLQCQQQQQQQQQTNSFTNFPTTSFTQPLLDDQIPVAASDMPCNVTDQNPELWDFDFMDHILSEDDLQALECYIEHDPAFDGEHNCPPNNISNGQEQL